MLAPGFVNNWSTTLKTSEVSRSDVKSLFIQVLDLHEQEREQFLREHPADRDVKTSVRQLLAANQDDHFLEPPSDQACLTHQEPNDALIGRKLGTFRLTRRLGIGSMGVVYEAQQEQPRRKVAVKILRNGGFEDPKRVQRFLHESELLAQMQHSGIVQVFASGMMPTEIGDLPWFAMELLEGERLDAWCTRENSQEARLRVLLDLLDAVHYAHQRGIVHRDLKPANILVIDGSGSAGVRTSQVKVVDFGVARLLVAPDQLDVPQTCTGEIIGTISYMSPEQLDGKAGYVDQRADVFAIGAIGYEMLSGQLPYPTSNLTLSEQIRSRQQAEPPLLGRLKPGLRGDLEAIFSRALAMPPNRRYSSAQDFADDLRRFLAGQPVYARRQSTARRFFKYIRRNYVAAWGVTATITALTIGMALYAYEAQQKRMEARRSAYEAEKATAINNFLTNDFMTNLLSATQRADGDRPQIEALIDESAATVDKMFGDRPTILAAVRNEVGTLYYNCQCFDKAARQYRLSMERWSKSLGQEHPDTLKASANLGLTLLCRGQLEEAEEALVRTLAGRRKVLGNRHADTCTTMNNLARVYEATHRFEEAEALLREAVAASRDADDLRNSVTFRSNLANLLSSRGDSAEAFRVRAEDYQECRRVFGEHHVFTLGVGFEYARALYKGQRYEEAIRILQPILEELQTAHGPSNELTILSARLLARAFGKTGHTEAALGLLRSTLESVRQLSNSNTSLSVLERDIARLDDQD